ncbi:MAG: AAA family ATPase [Gammaproteobacteria bacterium]
MRRIMVINSKGGCGKTTIASNLAAYYASQGKRTVLFDYDPQGSSLQWVRSRSPERFPVHGVPAYRGARDGVTRTWQLRVPTGSERVILDTPAGVGGQELADLCQRVHAIVVPVQPSPIDIHACSHFVRDLLLVGKVRTLNVRVAVVANRVRERTHGFSILERFLGSLNIPFITSLRDAQNYVKAAEQGIGIHELDAPFVQRDIDQWAPLLEWIESAPEEDTEQRAAVAPGSAVRSESAQVRA